MSMSVPWSENALAFLMSPPSPSYPLRDIILSVRTSMDINALAMSGRCLLRSCVTARMYNPPITKDFQDKIDAKLEDARLAHVARKLGVLERLNVHEVAIDASDVAHILCAYVGATLRCGWEKSFTNSIDASINDICLKIVDEDEVFATVENNSHERMLHIDGMQKMPQTPANSKPAPALASPIPSRGTRFTGDMEGNSNESVSSGPVPTASPAFIPQPPQHGPGVFPPGHGAYHQPQYPQGAYSSPPPPNVPPPTNGTPSGTWGASQNPPGYTMPSQPAAPAPTAMPMPMPPLPTQQTQGFISLFNELAMKNRMAVSWQQQKTGQQHIPEWTMWLIVDGTPRGHGTASTKQGAKEIAAKAALQAMGWLPA